MKTKEKKKAHYGLLVLLFLLIGLGIQAGLGYQRLTRGEARSKELLGELSLSAKAAAENETQRRAVLWQEAAPRLARLPEERLSAREGEDLSLLMLVNAEHPLPEDYAPELVQVEDKDGRTYQLDVRCAQAFWDMMADCAAAGGEPYICSGFRLRKDQEELFRDKIKRLIEGGTDPEEAPEEAAKTVAVPGTSEHESGLAADLIDESYPYLDELQEQTPTQKWLMENSWRYGFILRYPNGTTEQTGIIYEPWHYRYVGERYAGEIFRMGVTLEEYLQRREGR